jgi:anti-anti-sigma factor
LVAVGDHRGDEGAREVGLRIDVSERDGATIVAFHGELDLDEAPLAREALDDALGRGGDAVTVDLRDVTFLGSTGVRILIDAQAAAQARGCRLRVVQGEGPARRLIELLGLADRLDVADPGE